LRYSAILASFTAGSRNSSVRDLTISIACGLQSIAAMGFIDRLVSSFLASLPTPIARLALWTYELVRQMAFQTLPPYLIGAPPCSKSFGAWGHGIAHKRGNFLEIDRNGGGHSRSWGERGMNGFCNGSAATGSGMNGSGVNAPGVNGAHLSSAGSELEESSERGTDIAPSFGSRISVLLGQESSGAEASNKGLVFDFSVPPGAKELVIILKEVSSGCVDVAYNASTSLQLGSCVDTPNGYSAPSPEDPSERPSSETINPETPGAAVSLPIDVAAWLELVYCCNFITGFFLGLLRPVIGFWTDLVTGTTRLVTRMSMRVTAYFLAKALRLVLANLPGETVQY
jgi:hypothetical protein